MENVGKKDRLIRGLTGVVMLSVYFQDLELRAVGLVGTLLLITSVLAYCPFYGFFSKSRRREGEMPVAGKHQSGSLS